MRMTAVQHKVLLLTTLSAAVVNGIAALKAKELKVGSLQTHFKTRR